MGTHSSTVYLDRSDHSFYLWREKGLQSFPLQKVSSRSATAVLSYTNPGTVREDSLALFGWEHAADAYTSTGVASSVNTITNRVTGTSNHLSLFAVLGSPTGYFCR